MMTSSGILYTRIYTHMYVCMVCMERIIVDKSKRASNFDYFLRRSYDFCRPVWDI